jgi:hypothetical protein
MKYFFILFASLAIAMQAGAQLVINELMPCNISFVMDEYLNYSMWVEVYNSGSEAENLNDYFFTDSVERPQKWRPQRRMVPAKGFARVWFEREECAGHSSFKLEPEGGRLYLMKDGQVADAAVYPKTFRNSSYGRKTDGGAEWTHFREPSSGIDQQIQNPVTAIQNEETWNYWYKISPPPDEWNLIDFDDNSWIRNKKAPLGYGRRKVGTVIGAQNNPPAQAAYFRKKISIQDVDKIHVCMIKCTVDDAAAFFVNGTEVYRYNLPEGELKYEMGAVTPRVDPSEVSFYFPASLLTEGNNLIAVEVHQSRDLNSADLYFELSFDHSSPSSQPLWKEYSNDGRETAVKVCRAPEFTVAPGFYSKPVDAGFTAPDEGVTIRYTTDGSEPDESSTEYTGQPVRITKTTCLRAASFANGVMNGTISTGTYFVGERNFTLPVVSIVTEPKFLFDDEIGIYTEGVHVPANYWWDWDRPANFELFDALGVSRLNQELDISCAGMYSREWPQKSLKISPRNKFGDNRLRYDFFESKRGKKYKDIQLRNSGNDFPYTMLRDAFMQTIIIDRLDVDYLAYQPSVCFINGEYYGVSNLRERSNKDYLYTNYGLKEGEFSLLDQYAVTSDREYLEFRDYMENNSTDVIYDYASSKLDMVSLMDYIMSEIYYANTDFIVNNVKLWKPLTGNGRWRFILYDTDYGFGLGANYDHNTVSWVFDHQDNFIAPPIRSLAKNTEFKNKFLNRFCVHLSTTFDAKRVTHVLDSLSSKIAGEMVYHKRKFGNQNPFIDEISMMEVFAYDRADYVLQHLSSYFAGSRPIRKVSLSANDSRASFTFNSEPVPDNTPVTIKYFRNNPITVKAEDIEGNSFHHWELTASNGNVQIIPDRVYSATLSDNLTLKAIYGGGNSIGEINSGEHKPVRDVKYFDLLGREINGDSKGFVIKRTIYSDGTSESEKQYVK